MTGAGWFYLSSFSRGIGTHTMRRWGYDRQRLMLNKLLDGFEGKPTSLSVQILYYFCFSEEIILS
jgi:hypothetical protein